MKGEPMRVDILGKVEDKAKMEYVANLFRNAALKLHLKIEINETNNFSAFAKHSFNPALTPVVFIEGEIEFHGTAIQYNIIEKKLSDIRDKGSQVY